MFKHEKDIVMKKLNRNQLLILEHYDKALVLWELLVIMFRNGI